MTTWWKRLRDELDRRGWSVVEFERRTGIDKSKLYKYVTGEVSQPRGDAFELMSLALEVNETWLRTGRGMRSAHLPLFGKVGAGECWTQIECKEKTVSFELEHDEYIALQVSGSSMAPVFRNGDIVLCSLAWGRQLMKKAPNPWPRMECAVKLTAKEGVLKYVVPGSKAGVYTLRSYNPDYPDLIDVEVEWIAPVVWIKRTLRRHDQE